MGVFDAFPIDVNTKKIKSHDIPHNLLHLSRTDFLAAEHPTARREEDEAAMRAGRAERVREAIGRNRLRKDFEKYHVRVSVPKEKLALYATTPVLHIDEKTPGESPGVGGPSRDFLGSASCRKKLTSGRN